ncbi:MAG: archease [Chloroflexota bacterium]|nr:MAG: archease [Chloroflexota bacterium]
MSEPSALSESAGGFEIVDHTADWALRIYGGSLSDLLLNAALGMSALLVSDLYSVPLSVERDLELDAFDAETLLVDWLSELAYAAEDEGLVFREFQLRNISPNHLEACIRGGRPPALEKHIKAVTYNELAIQKTETGYTVTVVFDV